MREVSQAQKSLMHPTRQTVEVELEVGHSVGLIAVAGGLTDQDRLPAEVGVRVDAVGIRVLSGSRTPDIGPVVGTRKGPNDDGGFRR